MREAQADLIAKKQGECWIVEAKGLTSSVGLDFNTCLGQLVKWMSSAENIYALAIPKHEKYKRQCVLLPKYVRSVLKIHIIVVDADGVVTILKPEQAIEEAFDGK